MLIDWSRAGGLFVVAFILASLGTWLVREWARRVGAGQTVRSDGPASHLAKSGTPTLGGLGILMPIALLAAILWLPASGERRAGALLAVGVALLFAAIGFADDWAKLRYRRPLGLKARVRLPLQFIFAGLYAWALIKWRVVTEAAGPAQILPLGAGAGFVCFAMLVLVGAANAVNLTDGLDGLAAGVSTWCALCLAVACGLEGQYELALLCIILAGAAAGFLWHNAPPASIFMGDVGSLGLGALLGAIAIAARLELMLAIFGIIFVIEALSVIGQVLYFRLTKGRRILRMAPYHHHLELCGWPEPKIVVRFWLITLVAGALGLAFVASLTLNR